MSDPNQVPTQSPNPLQQAAEADTLARARRERQEAIERLQGFLGIQLPPLILLLAVFGAWFMRVNTQIGSTTWLVISGLVVFNYLHSAFQNRKLTKLAKLMNDAPPTAFRSRPRLGTPKRR